MLEVDGIHTYYGEVLAEGTFEEVKDDPRVFEVYLGGAG